MTRRSMFGLVLGALGAPFLPKPKVPGLMFHKDAFAFAMAPLEIYRSEDLACSVEDFARLVQPHLEAGQRQLAEAIDRG